VTVRHAGSSATAGTRALALGLALLLLCGCSLWRAECRTGAPGEPAAAAVPTDSARRPLGGANPELAGFADYHTHMFANEGFGGVLFAGTPFAPGGMPEALAPCQHTCNRHLVTSTIVSSAGEPPHGHDGWPRFETWPRQGTMLHQQMYVDWVYRAYTYGLRLLVVLAVNSETLCTLGHATKTCNDMEAVDRQLDAVHALARHVRDHEGGWLEIARSAEHARRLIGENRLALVIGIEVDTLFDCARPDDPGCQPESVRAALERYRERGVVQIAPIHVADNGFGGAALYGELFAANQHFLRGEHHGVAACDDPDVAWSLDQDVPVGFKLVTFFRRLRWYRSPVPGDLRGRGHCNARGLTEPGRELIRAMASQGMLIDVDHMSDRAAEETLQILEAARHPAMLSHAWPRDLKRGPDGLPDERRNEMQRSHEMLERIRRSHGLVGLLANQGPVVAEPRSGVRNDCPGSSKSFAQSFAHVAELMQGRGVGLGSDFNGLAGQPAGRFAGACEGSDDPSDPPLDYGSAELAGRRLDVHALGTLRFDYNEHGLAHYGLLPDFIADLQAVGLRPEHHDTLWSSARDYVETWSCAERSGSEDACAWQPPEPRSVAEGTSEPGN
jgi:microsomal dipeptidase-like Zn-dependent dipeptidase